MKYPVLIFLLALGTIPLVAQTAPRMSLSVDVAGFRYDSENSYVEIAYAVARGRLTYEKDNTGFSASALLHLDVARAGAKEPEVVRNWRIPVHVEDTAGLDDKLLIGKLRLVLTPGKVIMTITARDEKNAALTDTARFFATVPRFAARGPAMSDIQLCSSIRPIPPDTNNLFYKNTLEVVPNPTLLYGKNFQKLRYYLEVYNVTQPKFDLKTEVINSYGRTVVTAKERRGGAVPSRVEIGAVDCTTFPTGSYTLSVACLDTSAAILTSQTRQFYVFNPDVAPDTTQRSRIVMEISPDLVSLSEQEIDNLFGPTQYIATREELQIWKNLAGAESKKKFVTRFWADRDPDRSTALNEVYEDHLSRVAFANEQYRTPYRPGWKTDRGRVVIVYGKPDAVDHMAGESDAKPYEIWYYDSIQSGVQFVFVDKSGFGNYELVHSTLRGELSDTNWKRYIITN